MILISRHILPTKQQKNLLTYHLSSRVNSPTEEKKLSLHFILPFFSKLQVIYVILKHKKKMLIC